MCWKRQAIYQTAINCTIRSRLQALFENTFHPPRQQLLLAHGARAASGAAQPAPRLSPGGRTVGRVFAVKAGIESQRFSTFFGTTQVYFFTLRGWEKQNDGGLRPTSSTFWNRHKSGS